MNWISTTPFNILMVGISATGVFLAVILLTRVGGLRSFSKLSAFDFSITVAIGSIVAATVLSSNPPLLLAFASLTFLFVLQIGVAWLRTRSESVASLVDNKPLLLMDGTEILHENLKTGKLTVSDLHAKLREANVIEWNEIKAVVLESTGDVSVMHGADDKTLDERLMQGLRSAHNQDG